MSGGGATRGVMKPVNLTDGQTIKHKYKKGVTGEVKLIGGDWRVKWSDGDAYEHLHVGDMVIKG